MSERIKQDGDANLPEKRAPNANEASARSQPQDLLKNPSELPAEEPAQDASSEQVGGPSPDQTDAEGTEAQPAEPTLEPPSAEIVPFGELPAETPANPPDILGLPQDEVQPADLVQTADELADPAAAGPAAGDDVSLEPALVNDSLEDLVDSAPDEPPSYEPTGNGEANAAELEDGAIDQPSLEIGDAETDTVSTEVDRSIDLSGFHEFKR
ncbi:MAG TPA: hypothetical protein VGJ16_08100 [Pirellulales bacterium]|jgi:hypothetical protein